VIFLSVYSFYYPNFPIPPSKPPAIDVKGLLPFIKPPANDFREPNPLNKPRPELFPLDLFLSFLNLLLSFLLSFFIFLLESDSPREFWIKLYPTSLIIGFEISIPEIDFYSLLETYIIY
jgi:hypothetical protein